MKKVAILLLLAGFNCQASASMYFVAYSVDENSLYTLSLGDMEPTKIGTLEIEPYPATSTWALVKASEDSAYMVERYSDTLYTVSLNDASTLLSVPLDRDVEINPRGLAISPKGILYGLFSGNELRTIEPATGETTFVATVDIPLIESFAFAPDGTLYAGTDNGGKLYTIDVDTGSSSFIAETICPDIDALTYAPDGFLYAADSRAGTVADLYRIDPLTGESFNLGTTGITELNGLLAIPEPATFLLLSLGGMALLRSRRMVE